MVQKYGSQGPGARLPDLLVGRENHACGFYVNKEGQIVRVNCKHFCEDKSNLYFQVLLGKTLE